LASVTWLSCTADRSAFFTADIAAVRTAQKLPASRPANGRKDHRNARVAKRIQ
jgi:hypothetical protein